MRRTIILMIALVCIAGAAQAQIIAGPGDTLKFPLELRDSVANPTAVDSAGDSVLVRVIKLNAANASGADTCYLHRGLMDASTNTLLHTTGNATTTLGLGSTPKRLQTFSFFATAYTLTGSATASGLYQIQVYTYDASLNLITRDKYTLNYIYQGASTYTFAMWADTLALAARWTMKSFAPDSTAAGYPKVDVYSVAATAQTARDIGASVLLSSGTGTGQLDFTSGVVKANATQWNGSAVATPNVAGYPLVDLVKVMGTNTDTTGASGRLAVNMRYVANQLCAASAGVTFPSSIASPTNITSATGIQVGSYAAGQDPGTKVWGDNDSTWAGGTMGNMAKNDSTVLYSVRQAMLDLAAWSGARADAGGKYYRGTSYDSLVIDTNGVRVGKRVYKHIGGTSGGVPDSTRTGTGGGLFN